MSTDLIIFKDNKPIISDDFKKNYKKFIDLKNQIEEAQKIIKDNMISYFESLPEEERKIIDFNGFKISYCKEYTKNNFDSKKFQDDYPDIYTKYLKETQVKSTIKFL